MKNLLLLFVALGVAAFASGCSSSARVGTPDHHASVDAAVR